MKNEFLSSFYIFATNWKPSIKIWNFCSPFTLVIENLQNHLIFKILIFNFSFWKKILQ
jgi:hypothetical protein